MTRAGQERAAEGCRQRQWRGSARTAVAWSGQLGAPDLPCCPRLFLPLWKCDLASRLGGLVRCGPCSVIVKGAGNSVDTQRRAKNWVSSWTSRTVNVPQPAPTRRLSQPAMHARTGIKRNQLRSPKDPQKLVCILHTKHSKPGSMADELAELIDFLSDSRPPVRRHTLDDSGAGTCCRRCHRHERPSSRTPPSSCCRSSSTRQSLCRG